MKLKKLVSLSLVTIMTISMFSGCGKSTKKEIYVPTLPTGVEEASIFVEAVPGIKDDFIKGVDISSVIAEEEAGVVYKNANGEAEDLFKLLADNGVNYVRVRVWVDPYDENGNGYGGGNNDYEKAAIIGARAADYGMKTLVDFHYSDFWADPTKQMVPKAWEGMDYRAKSEACYEYTLKAMNYILDGGADVGMVQIGNETNTGMAGETLWSAISVIMNKGREAVLEAGKAHKKEDIKIAVHFTNPENKNGIREILRKLEANNVEYDVFALSYYPFWHGTLNNLTSVMKEINEKTGKEVMVAETSYAYTLLGEGNSVSEKDLNPDYAATYQSQANAFRDVCEAVVNVGDAGLGVFYWEPAWLQAQAKEDSAAGSQYEKNMKLWNETGSGWASKYAGSYDPKDAGEFYGGSSWANQAMFDFDGVALPSLAVFKYLKYGATCALKADFYNDISVDMLPGDDVKIPDAVLVNYNDRSKNGLSKVNWSQADIEKIDNSKPGRYNVSGTFEDGSVVNCLVKIAAENLMPDYSFEERRGAGWTVEAADPSTVDFQDKASDALTGDYSMHYWNKGAVEFDAFYTFEGLEPGTYTFSVNAQGGDSGKDADMYIYSISDGAREQKSFSVDGWINWKHPEISEIVVSSGTVTVGIHVSAAEGAWGTFDDIYFGRIE